MSPEDRSLARQVRRSIAKAMIDISQMDISCYNGVIELTGKVKPLRHAPGGTPVNPRKEFENLKQMIRNTRGVKGVYADRVSIYD